METRWSWLTMPQMLDSEILLMEGVFVLPNSPLTLSIQLEAVENTDLLKPEERLWLKADILRRTLLVEWLTISDIRSIPPPDSKLLNWQRWQREFWLNAHLQNVRLGKDTLAQMEIFRAPGTLSPEFSSFPNWRLLLPELQAKILDWLTSPVDKLNVLEAYPKAAGVMGKKWKSASALRFEAIFPERFGGSRGLSWNNWDYMDVLRLTTPEIRSVVNEQFSKYLNTGDYEEGYYTGHFKDLIRSNGIRWSNLDPITCRVLLDFGMEDPEDPNANYMHRDFANWIGPRTWHCCFFYSDYSDWSFSPVQFIKRMAKCLEKMRNLRKMVVDVFMENWDVSWVEIEFLALPDLPYLHSIVFQIENSGPEETLIRRMLMERYASQLNRIEFTFNCDTNTIPPLIPNWFPADFHHPFDFPALPQLTIWKCISNIPHGWGWGLHCELLQKVVGSPLKVAHFTVDVSAGETGFSDFLNVLGKGFGGTLEELSIQAKTAAGEGIPASWKRQSGGKWKTNLVNVRFPKLKQFKINVDPCPEGWEFLLIFPALEKLKFFFSTDDQIGNAQADREDAIVELSSNLETMQQANIWKLLPNLKEIIVRKQVALQFGHYMMRSERMTRDEVITAAAN